MRLSLKRKALAVILAVATASTMFVGAGSAYAQEEEQSVAAPSATYVTAAATRAAMSAPEILGLTGVEETGPGVFYTAPVNNWQTPKYKFYGTGIGLEDNPYFVAEVASPGTGPVIDASRSGGGAGPDSALDAYGSGFNPDDAVWADKPDVVIGTNQNDATVLANYATAGSSLIYTVYPVEYLTTAAGGGLDGSSPSLINTMYDIATAADSAAALTKKSLRYVGTGKQYASSFAIAQTYERYIRGTQGYILSNLDQDANYNPIITKTFALVTAYNSSTGYTIAPNNAGGGSANEHRYVEACRYVANNLNATASAIDVPAATLANADLVMVGSQGLSYAAQLSLVAQLQSDGMWGMVYWVNAADGTCPGSTYGVIMNSVENAQNYGRILGCLYPKLIDQTSYVAYYMEWLEHLDASNSSAFEANVTAAMSNGGDPTYRGVPWYNTYTGTITYGWSVINYDSATVASQLALGINYLKTKYPAKPAALVPTANI